MKGNLFLFEQLIPKNQIPYHILRVPENSDCLAAPNMHGHKNAYVCSHSLIIAQNDNECGNKSKPRNEQ